MCINYIFLPGLVKRVQVWAGPGSVDPFMLPSPPAMPSASWTVNWLTAPFLLCQSGKVMTVVIWGWFPKWVGKMDL